VDYAITDAGPIYDDLTFRHTTAMLDEDLMVFIDQVQARTVHTLDIAYHRKGTWARNLTGGTGWTPSQRDGYSYLRDAQIVRADTGVALGVCNKPYWSPSTIFLARGNMTETITATGVGAHEEDRVPMVIFRRQSRDTAFGWGVSVSGKVVTMQPLNVVNAAGQAVSPSTASAFWVTVENSPNRALVTNPDRLPLTVSLTDGSLWTTQRVFDVGDF